METGAPWASGEPDISRHCVALSIDGQWLTRDCDDHAPFVCQAKQTTIQNSTNLTQYYEYTGDFTYLTHYYEIFMYDLFDLHDLV